VELEVAFAHLAADEAELEAALWLELDEQAIPLDQRRRLNANGFRAGLTGATLPASLQSLLDRTAQEASRAPDADAVAGEDAPSLAQRRLHLLPGKRGKIIVSPTLPTLSILTVDPEQRVHGQLLSTAQCLLSIKAYPSADGSVEVEIVPEIEHGEVRNRWIPVDGALVQQIGKDRHTCEQLRLEQRLLAGQSLVLGSTSEPCGTGQPFFMAGAGSGRRLLLLIRLASTSKDELFDQPPSGGNVVAALR
jgi:hypothetical protein